MTPRALVVLAGGLGSRYGGLKQLEPVGPSGETLMDYAVHDAVRAGFTTAVFVIRPDRQDTFAPIAEARYGRRLKVRVAPQHLDDLPELLAPPPGRTRPWGTAHAVLAASARMTGPFAVVNADDWYGAEAFDAAARFFDETSDPDTWAAVGYRLAETLSPHGGVNRALLRTDADGWLTGIEELRGLTPSSPLSSPHLPPSPLVSMNLWLLTPTVFPAIRRALAAFVRAGPGPDDELLLPDVIGAAVARGAARVKVLDPGARWFGLTHAADKPAVMARLAELTAAGRYPSPLW